MAKTQKTAATNRGQEPESASSAGEREADLNPLVKALLEYIFCAGEVEVTASQLTEVLGLKSERSVWRKLNTEIEPYGYIFKRGSLERIPADNGVEREPDSDDDDTNNEGNEEEGDDDDGDDAGEEDAMEEDATESDSGSQVIENASTGKKRKLEDDESLLPEQEDG